MKRFLLMLLAVMFCTSALCTLDVNAKENTSEQTTKSETESNQNSVQNNKPSVINITTGAYSAEEVYLTAKLVYHEAHNQSFEGKVAIAEVVLNRLRSSLFPNSVEEVLYQRGQFAGRNGLRRVEPTDEEISLTNDVLNGTLRVLKDPTVMYFRNPRITSGISANTVKNWGKLKYFTCIGEHAFYSQEIKTDDDTVGIPSEVLKARALAEKKARLLRCRAEGVIPCDDEYTDDTEIIPADDDMTEEEMLLMQQAIEAQAAAQAELELHEAARAAKEAEMEANTRLALEMQEAARAAKEAEMEANTQRAIELQLISAETGGIKESDI